jgi:hypothetical protein
MAKSIRQALLANEVANLAFFNKVEPTVQPKVDKKVSTVKVDSKLKPKADKKHSKAELAKSSKMTAEFRAILDRPYGKEGHTFGEAIEHQATVYNSMLKQKRNQLEKLKVMGELLIEFRAIIGKSDKEFGQAIKATALSSVSRQDRSDAMWLAENWTTVQKKVKELDINSCSASYLRQLLRKEAKSTPSEATAKSAVSEANESDDATSSEASVTVESSSLKLAENSAEGIASAVIHLAKANGISLAEIATLLLAESEVA